MATYNTELGRDGPGLLLRDILSGEDADVLSVGGVIAEVAPDVLVLQGFDHDHGLVALGAFADHLASLGLSYPHRVALAPNSGMATGIDLDGDGRLGEPEDAQGFGWFAGAGGMAVLARVPVLGVRDFSHLPWADLPGNLIAADTLPEGAGAVQRLSSHGHWVVTLEGPGGVPFDLWTYFATPPVFDGPEDRNGRRNHDETAFWLRYLEGAFGAVPEGPFVLAGDANLDPADGDGRGAAMRALLTHARVQDPAPRSDRAVAAAAAEAGANAGHRGDPALDTANWSDVPGPGNLRVDYVLPSREWQVVGAGVVWPTPEASGGDGDHGSRHGLVWADLVLQGTP
ncbi:MAG: endonuclease/exonuclease/phosphatase family protein [Pseudomonadota bacterium]